MSECFVLICLSPFRYTMLASVRSWHCKKSTPEYYQVLITLCAVVEFRPLLRGHVTLGTLVATVDVGNMAVDMRRPLCGHLDNGRTTSLLSKILI